MSIFPSPGRAQPQEPLARQGAGEAAWGSEEPVPLSPERSFASPGMGVQYTAFCLVFLSDLSCSIWKKTPSFGINFQADWKVYPYGCGWGFSLHVPDRGLNLFSLTG